MLLSKIGKNILLLQNITPYLHEYKKEDKSEICVVQSISVGESPFFLLYIELAASSCRPLRISSTKKEIPSFIVFIKDYSGNVPKRGYLYTRLPNMYIINLL